MTPSEFLRDFYTCRRLHDKLADVDALVATYGHEMPLLYAELDKKCGNVCMCGYCISVFAGTC